MQACFQAALCQREMRGNRRGNGHSVEAQLKELSTAVGRLANAVAGGSGAVNGRGAAAGPDDADAEVVVIGRGSYHRPDCRLVATMDMLLVPSALSVALA